MAEDSAKIELAHKAVESADRTSVELPETGSQVASTLPSGATTPALPELSFPEKVREAIETKTVSQADQSTGAKRTDKHATASSDNAVIIGIAVVDFNHLVGPQIEYAHPKEVAEDEELRSNLPFLALPDGSHLVRWKVHKDVFADTR